MIGKHTLKFLRNPFCGQGFVNTSCSVFVQLHSFPLCPNRPMKQEINTKHFWTHRQGEHTTSVIQWVVWSAGGPGVLRSTPLMARREHVKGCWMWKYNRSCVLKVQAIFKTSHFSNKTTFCALPDVSNQGPLYLEACRPANYAIVIQCWPVNIWTVCVSIHVLFSILDGSSAPVTCSCVPNNLKRVSQGLEHGWTPYSESELVVFHIHANQKKNQNFLSADQTSIPGLNQVFPVLEWNLIFVLLSKILNHLKRSFVVQIPRVTLYREMRNTYA